MRDIQTIIVDVDGKWYMPLHHPKPAENIIKVSDNHKDEQEAHTYVLGYLHKLKTWLLASDYLHKEEENMTTI